MEKGGSKSGGFLAYNKNVVCASPNGVWSHFDNRQKHTHHGPGLIRT
jgi:hypothetical protein